MIQPKTEDIDRIRSEVNRQTSLCQCLKKYDVEQIGEGRYRVRRSKRKERKQRRNIFQFVFSLVKLKVFVSFEFFVQQLWFVLVVDGHHSMNISLVMIRVEVIINLTFLSQCSHRISIEQDAFRLRIRAISVGSPCIL